MKILEEILIEKKKDVSERRELYPLKLLEKSPYFESTSVSLKQYLQREDMLGVIAEIKRRSPSKGTINEFVDIESLSIGYMQAGASALSVLTDSKFFGGSSQDLTIARACNFCPVLRKDFIVDEYQVIEAKSIGADAILLIAAALSCEEMKRFSELAHSLGLEVLAEVHTREELHKIPLHLVDIIGVNNRDLNTFHVDITTSLELLSILPTEIARISESGIETPADLVRLRQAGFNGVLIGETFMRHSRPQDACKAFISKARELLI